MENLTNTQKAINFYESAFNGNVKEAVERYVGDVYIQHNPVVADGKEGFIDYFTRMYDAYPVKSIRFLRTVEQDDLVALHTHQIWGEPDNKEYVTMDFFRFEQGKIVEHWDSIQEVIYDTKNGRDMF